MTGRKKLLAAFVALIIAVLLFSVLWVAVIYLGWWNQQQAAYQDIDLSLWTADGNVITVPAEAIENGEATIILDEEWNPVVKDVVLEEEPSIELDNVAPTDDLPENTAE